MEELVGYVKRNKNSIGLQLSVDAINQVKRYSENGYIHLEVDLEKIKELMDKERDATAVRYVNNE